VPLCDDELYAWLERHGVEGLVPYQPGMRLEQTPRTELAAIPQAGTPGPAPAEQRKAA
jgi:hypothetical protein